MENYNWETEQSHSNNTETMNEFINLPPLRQPRKVKPKPLPMPQWCKEVYCQAHEKNFAAEYQIAYNGGHYFKPVMPDCNKSGGLQQAIIKFLLWNGHRATRISSAGRKIGDKWIPGTTRKGSADISATIKGRSVMLEVKVNLDTPSPEQLREQDLERKAGGVYEFVNSFEEFLTIYGKL